LDDTQTDPEKRWLEKALLHQGLIDTLLKLFRLKTHSVDSLGKGNFKLSVQIDFKDATEFFPFRDCHLDSISWGDR